MFVKGGLEFSSLFFTTGTAGTENNNGENSETESTKVVGCEIKTRSWKTLRSFTELRWNVEKMW